MFLIRSSTRGRERGGEGKGGEGEIQFFPPIVPENREPEEKDIEQSSKEGNEFFNYPIGFVYFYYLVFRIDRRRYRSKGSENESIESKASAGERGEGGREKGGKDFRSTKSSLVLFIFFLQTPNLFSPSIPSPVAVFTSPTDFVQRMGTIRFLSGEHPDAIQFRSLHHHCSRLSKIYPIVATVPSLRLRRYIAHRYPAALFENPRGSRIKNPKLLACHIRVIVCL